MIKVSVIIVLYNEYEKMKETIASVYENKIGEMEIIVIDNSPKTRDYASVRKLFPRVRYYRSKKNLGFAGGVNQGINIANGEFFLIITPDMYLLPNTLVRTLTYIENHPEVGLVGSKVFSSPSQQEPSILSTYPNLFTQLYYYNMPFYKLLNRFAKNFQPMYLSASEHKKIQYAIAISGQYILIRKKAISQINYFDQQFFLYFEDIDLSKRLNEKGWKVVYLPFGGVVQNGITSWKKTKITQAHPVYLESNYRFFYKHYGKLYLFLAWGVGAFSALMSIPYLAAVQYVKALQHSSSQAAELLPLWKRITKWHFTRGIHLLFE